MHNSFSEDRQSQRQRAKLCKFVLFLAAAASLAVLFRLDAASRHRQPLAPPISAADSVVQG